MMMMASLKELCYFFVNLLYLFLFYIFLNSEYIVKSFHLINFLISSIRLILKFNFDGNYLFLYFKDSMSIQF